MRNANTKPAASDFKKRYSELAANIKAVKAKLKEALNDANKISKDANKLYWFGNNNLYVDNDYGIRPAFADLPKKMDKLNEWKDIRLDIYRLYTSI